MKIAFIDFTKFKYSFFDKYSKILRGAETVLINLSYSLKNLGHEIYIFNNCSKAYTETNYYWSDITEIKKKNIIFDIAIANGDMNLLNNVVSKKKFAISYSLQSIEKFLRKGQLIPYLKHKPRILFIGSYHEKQRSKFLKLFGSNILNLSVDEIFLKEKINDLVTNNKAIFTSRPDRNMELLIKIWINEIYPNSTNSKLFITPNLKFKNNKYNIFFRKFDSQKDLVLDLKSSKVMLIPGHKAELFCLAAEEARELCVPIVTLGIGCLKERVIHEKTGFIAKNEKEFAKYALDIFNDNNLCSELRNNLIRLRGTKNWILSAKDLVSKIN